MPFRLPDTAAKVRAFQSAHLVFDGATLGHYAAKQ